MPGAPCRSGRERGQAGKPRKLGRDALLQKLKKVTGGGGGGGKGGKGKSGKKGKGKGKGRK